MSRVRSVRRNFLPAVALGFGLSLLTGGCGADPAVPPAAEAAPQVTESVGTADRNDPAPATPTTTAPDTADASNSQNTSPNDDATQPIESETAETDLEGSHQNWVTEQTGQATCDSDEKTLTGVRVGRHDGFDRVVFDLSGTGAPCYRIFFDPNPVQDGSGFPIDLGDNQALRVEILQLGPEFPTVPAGYEAALDGPAVTYARFDTFFEGVATSFIAVPDGVNAQYSVSTLPGRLIVDVRAVN